MSVKDIAKELKSGTSMNPVKMMTKGRQKPQAMRACLLVELSARALTEILENVEDP